MLSSAFRLCMISEHLADHMRIFFFSDAFNVYNEIIVTNQPHSVIFSSKRAYKEGTPLHICAYLRVFPFERIAS